MTAVSAASAKTKAGPSATLRFAQDDRFVGRGESRKAKAKADSLREWQQKAKARSTAGPSAMLRSAQDDNSWEVIHRATQLLVLHCVSCFVGMDEWDNHENSRK